MSASIVDFSHGLLVWLLLPPGALLIALAVGLALSGRHPRLGRTLIGCATAALALLSMPIVGDGLTRLTGKFAPFDSREMGAAQAIVVLGAERTGAAEYGGVTVGDFTLERLRLAARIARASGLPVLVSGGRADADEEPSMAELMQRALREDFGCTARWLEGNSRNTRENAGLSAPILRTSGVRTIILVTHYAHMRRAMGEFRSAGLQVVPAPVGVPVFRYPGVVSAIRPNLHTLRESSLALHELVGLAAAALWPSS